MKIRIATRKSALALAQTKLVTQQLLDHFPALQIEWVQTVTEGDRIQDQSLAAIGGKGLFIKRLEEMLLAGEADIAVHSLKDMPPVLEAPFCLSAVLLRNSPFDALVSLQHQKLEHLPANAVVGTSSVRRQAALLYQRPDLRVKALRGNVDTRLKKLQAGEYDALILAEAGLNRLGLASVVTERLPGEFFLPSVGQGVIAIEALRQREDLSTILSVLNDHETRVCIEAERTMNQALHANCNSPVGSFASVHAGILELKGAVWAINGAVKYETLQRGRLSEARLLGRQAAADLIAQGVTFEGMS